MSYKVKCKECGWKGGSEKLLHAFNPFDKNEMILGCPSCKSIDSEERVCENKDCWSIASMGNPTKNGYIFSIVISLIIFIAIGIFYLGLK